MLADFLFESATAEAQVLSKSPEKPLCALPLLVFDGILSFCHADRREASPS